MGGDPLGHDLTTLTAMPDEQHTEADPNDERSAEEKSFVAAYDLDGDGEVSAVEDVRENSASPMPASSRSPTRVAPRARSPTWCITSSTSSTTTDLGRGPTPGESHESADS